MEISKNSHNQGQQKFVIKSKLPAHHQRSENSDPDIPFPADH